MLQGLTATAPSPPLAGPPHATFGHTPDGFHTGSEKGRSAVSQRLTPQAWYQQLAGLPHATFSHTPAWARIVREVWGGETAAILHPTPDGQQALLPIVRRRLARGWLDWTVSGDTGVYGGPLLPQTMEAGAWPAFWQDLRQTFGPVTLIIPPGVAWQPPRHGRVVMRSTHRMALDQHPVGQAYSRGLRSRLNRARRLGVTVAVAADAEGVAIYDQMYRETLGRWGDRTSWVRPPAFFRALHQHGTPQVRLWLATLAGTAIAGIWVATFGGEAHYLGGATGQAGLAAGGSHLLLDHALSAAAADGCRTFDFGASGGWPGLVQFKEGFGARPEAYGEVHLWPPAMRLYWHLKHGRLLRTEPEAGNPRAGTQPREQEEPC